MTNMAVKRVLREFKEVCTCSEMELCGIRLSTVADTYSNLEGEIRGPPDSPYESGVFQLTIQIPEGYPFHPPKVKFITKIWHPNVSSVTGAICLDVLKDQWAASMTLRTVLLSLQALLGSPEPRDPQDAIVAKQMMDDPSLFNQTAKYWTVIYAHSSQSRNEDFDTKVRFLTEMGVARDNAISALSQCRWKVPEALEHLFR